MMNKAMMTDDTIAAIATASGVGGIGVIRLSGHLVPNIILSLLGKPAQARYAHFCQFRNAQKELLDEGILIYFPAPYSFTGEDVLELQGHGGMVVLDRLLQYCLQQGARLARAGEFSERAFLNGKLDLTQAEAIADLIASQSEAQAKAALHSLQGAFSNKINQLVKRVTALRVYIEAAIDFVDEEIDFLAEGQMQTQLLSLHVELGDVLAQTQQGRLLHDGLTVVLGGAPNAGKSSLLNALSGQDSAIVTAIAGTTRDVLREKIQINGLPLHIIDTAGLREHTDDPIEQEGIRRARVAMQHADILLWLVDASDPTIDITQPIYPSDLPEHIKKLMVFNKIDKTERLAGLCQSGIAISAKTGAGLDILKTTLTTQLGYQPEKSLFSARRRHVEALTAAQTALEQGINNLALNSATELLAEDLRLVQTYLGEITGAVTSDALLGHIFSSFCIGK